MMLVDLPYMDMALATTRNGTTTVPGGSACNTTVGIAKLGGLSRFIGKCGKDELAALFEEALRTNGVEPHLFKSASPTGRVLSIITPDAQRSMFTFLGASSELTVDEVAASEFSDVAIVHVEGYLLFNEELIYAAVKCAKNAGALISLDLASYTIVEASRDILEDIVERYVDILIGNEDEVRAFTGRNDEEAAIASLARKADIAVLKVGARGSYIARDADIVKIEPVTGLGEVVDTTGAGDLWASGFLFGMVNGFPLEKCGVLGSACGYEVCRVVGANIPDEGWNRIRARIK
jgi:sugar/nucleoside kinase (ribokinase family)